MFKKSFLAFTAFGLMLFTQSCGGKVPSKVFNPDVAWGGDSIEYKAKANAKTQMELDAEQRGLPAGSLLRTFDQPFETVWGKALDVMLALPLVTVDKADSIILTDWILDEKRSRETLEAYSGVTLFERSRYVVKIYDKNGSSEVAVIQLAQRAKDRFWVNGIIRRSNSEEMMKKIADKLGGQ
jgi:hypothetical protein